MKKFHLFLFILFAGFTIIFSSCRKSIENKIEGKWRRVKVDTVYSTNFQDWVFQGGYLYIIKSGNWGTDTLSTGTYTIRTGLFKRYIGLATASDPSLTDEWTIDKLSSKQLVIFKDNGGLEYREFAKE